MTWEQWIESDYNVDGWVIGRWDQIAKTTETDLLVLKPGTTQPVEPTDVIIANAAYDYNNVP